MSGTEAVKRRYDRLARFYDLLEGPAKSIRFGGWRARLPNRVTGLRALEVGVGTGKNMPFYPAGGQVTAIDFSPGMLARARARADTLGIEVDLRQMDVQSLFFEDRTFDTAWATFIFCSVPDPVRGLEEMRRVCKADGRLLLLEHARRANPAAWLRG
ncbi:MAG: methyltransferase domain-containing protein [Proteobacteria bacterium]|nr:methyltransferase domain-containing protein [Pseudomonadota bacterium]